MSRIRRLLFLCGFYITTTVSTRFWEQGGASMRAISPKCALGEGLSSKGQMRGLPAFLAMLDRLYANNVTILQLFTVYDSGLEL